ncbi:coniferyl aldehyde dehydrogenase [Spongiibacter marinus]|uniref:coniferyl aldehyde dehydrogenase n=1 Tax=Spongiibacter marinus TaxID=354246 RepID=UPI000412F6BF|nr:coniferyl aldehyde dehydrogenase [Spongiibacter marinus]
MTSMCVETNEYLPIYNKQRSAFEKNKYLSSSERKAYLKALIKAVEANKPEIIGALNADFGVRSTEETRLSEISSSISNLEYARANVAKWMGTERRHTGIWFWPASNRLMPQPIGVVGIIVPWNYPINIALSCMASALAAGNRCIVKMSECTPNSEAVLRKIVAEVFDEDHVSIVGGDASASARFTEIPFDHILFTGSTRVGQLIMAAASKNLTPVTLELGGKSPVIVDSGYPIDHVAKKVLWGKTYNAGQTCIAPDYILLPKGTAKDFSIWMTRLFSERFPAGIASEDYTSIINRATYDRLSKLIDSEDLCADEVIQVEQPNEENISKRKFPLTLVLNPSPESRLMKEEIFGPILPVIEVDSVGDAIDFVNDRDRPLALYLFSDSGSLQDEVLYKTHAGGTTINDVLLHYLQPAQPFGGIGKSGFGTYHGYEGFRTFSHNKPIVKQRSLLGFSGVELLYPPYTKLAKSLISMMKG